MRKIIIAGNWKMNTDMKSAKALAEGIVEGVAGLDLPEHFDVVLCPPFVWLPIVQGSIGSSRVKLGAQNASYEADGALTGEISISMLRSVGCEYVIVGHSERRTLFAESDLEVRRKAAAVADAGLKPIVCVGETISEREVGHVESVIDRQVREAFAGLDSTGAASYVIAYEPIWAIGTGQTATPEQAQEVHAFIRRILASLYDAGIADDISIIYGGSVNPGNAASLFAQPDIDGALVGGASLKVDSFMAIVAAT
jgi:triosephosphate isomerase